MRLSAGETATAFMRPLVPPQFLGVGGGAVGLGPIGFQTCRSPATSAEARAGFRKRLSQAARRADAGTEPNGYARLNMNQFERASTSSPGAPGLEDLCGGGVGNGARGFLKLATDFFKLARAAFRLTRFFARPRA